MEAGQDLWLERWLPLLLAEAAPKPVLELGCDTGRDTGWLLGHGLSVVATDLALEALQKARQAAPGALLLQHDLRTPLPFMSASFNVVVASLSLHYFDADTTVRAIAEVRRCLAPGGLLFCRVNSANDFQHGAGVGEEIEPGYFRQSARYAECKRFFSAGDVERFFPSHDWHAVSREEREVLRYDAPKMAWELVLRAPG
ncbi:MAG: SAM-dependent methyltransferase [Ramlibacter sp.]|nr:SAM-dependent methyltransferase [Ramlibacter sp.]